MEETIKSAIRDVPDFPKAGIIFKDITPILKDPELTNAITEEFVKRMDKSIDVVVGIESRGFFWATLIAQALKVPFVPLRKKGKLPYKTISYKYDLEYGSAEIEMHEDAIQEGMNVHIHDDLLATGGTALAAAELIQGQGAHVEGFSFLVGLNFLNGKAVLEKYSNNIICLTNY